jgi:hypothetical protein
MFVRQLIGREAGNIIDMPYSAAQSCLAMGTVASVTDDEIAAAGLETEPVTANLPDEFPRGFRVEALPEGGFDLFDPGGVNISEEVTLPNLVAARDYAWNIVNPAPPAPEPTALDKLNKADLLKIAEDAHVEVASSAKKADIIAALIAGGITAPPVAVEGSGEGAGDGASGSGETGTAEGDSGAATGDGAGSDSAQTNSDDGQSSGEANTSGQAE